MGGVGRGREGRVNGTNFSYKIDKYQVYKIWASPVAQTKNITYNMINIINTAVCYI